MSNKNTDLFGGFPKQVEYRECIGKDKTNNFKYEDPVMVNVRYCGERDEAKIGASQAIEHYGLYHSPFEPSDNSLIDGKRVEKKSPVPDVTGAIKYYRVWVV